MSNTISYTDIKEIVFNTMDLCGNTYEACKDLYYDRGLTPNDNMENMRFKALQEYQKEADQINNL